MIYLNGQIGAVYMGGRYHSKVYLGSMLVWQNVEKIPGEAHAQLAFENTANGVVAVLVPGEATEELAMAANVMAEAHGTTNGSSDELLTLLTATEPTMVEVSDSVALENLLLQCTALGKDIIVNKRQIEELLKLTTSVPPAVALGLVPVGDVGDELTMETTIPPAVALVLLPIETGDALTLTTPVPPAVAATLVDDKASLALQLVQTASAGDVVLFADGQLDGGEVIAAAAEGAVANGADGVVESKFTIGSMTQPEILEVMSQEATDNLKLRFTAKWTRGVGEKSSEDCKIMAQAVGHAQMGDTILIGIEGNQILQLTASVVGTAVEPVPEKTRAAQYIEGTLEEINLDDWPNGITEIPDNTIIMQQCLKNVAIPTSIKVIGESVLNTCHVETVTFGDASKLTIKVGFVSETIRTAMILSDDEFDLDFPKFFDNTVVDFSALRFVPTFIDNKDTGVTVVFELAKEIRVKKSLVSGWKSLSLLTDDTKNKIVGV